jgi:hypothetical protein
MLLAAILLVWGIALAIGATGCGGGKKSTQPPPPDTPPNPNTPVNALLLMQWAIQHRDTSQYRTLFTNDYDFVFVAGDTASTNHFAGTWGYAEERTSARHLFVEGSANGAVATSITFPLSGTPVDEPDLRPGKNPTFHRKITALFVLTVQKADLTSEQIVGGGTFFMVRGDSADVPSDLIAAGVQANSSRWFMEHWVDETGGVGPVLALRPAAGPARPLAVSLPTWGQLKVKYLAP